MTVIDRAKQCGNNAEVKYPSDVYAFSIAYDSYMKGHKDTAEQLEKAKAILKGIVEESFTLSDGHLCIDWKMIELARQFLKQE